MGDRVTLDELDTLTRNIPLIEYDFEHDVGADSKEIAKIVRDVKNGDISSAKEWSEVFYRKIGAELFDTSFENLTTGDFKVGQSSYMGKGRYDSVTLGHYRSVYGSNDEQTVYQEVKVEALLDSNNLGFVNRTDGLVSFEDEAKLVVSGHVRSDVLEKLQDYLASDEFYKLSPMDRNFFRSVKIKDAYAEKMEEFAEIFEVIRRKGYHPKLNIDFYGRCEVYVANQDRSEFIFCKCGNVKAFSESFFKSALEFSPKSISKLRISAYRMDSERIGNEYYFEDRPLREIETEVYDGLKKFRQDMIRLSSSVINHADAGKKLLPYHKWPEGRKAEFGAVNQMLRDGGLDLYIDLSTSSQNICVVDRDSGNRMGFRNILDSSDFMDKFGQAVDSWDVSVVPKKKALLCFNKYGYMDEDTGTLYIGDEPASTYFREEMNAESSFKKHCSDVTEVMRRHFGEKGVIVEHGLDKERNKRSHEL